MNEAALTGRAEWKRYGTLPIAAALGYATSVIHIYGLSPYIEPISEEFGWTRTRTTVGLTIAVAVQAFLAVPIGFMVDRIGPRLLGLIGIIATCACYALIGTATGDAWNWYLLWLLLAFAVLPAQATIWTSAVATRFEASRGLAFAVTLCGASVAQTLFPWLGARLIEDNGWQTAMALQGLIWFAIAFPIIFIFFRGARDKQRGTAKAAAVEPARELEGIGFVEGLRSSVYLRLLLASLLFTFAVLGLIVHYLPILTEGGIDRIQAAEMAAIIGIASLVGRLCTGFLLDRLRGSYVGAIAFLLPLAGCLIIMLAGGDMFALFLASALIGLSLGAEIDVIVYLTTRYFGLKSFGALYGGLLAALSVGTATGPLLAAWIFDQNGSYAAFLWLTIGAMLASSIALVTLPRSLASREAA